MVLGRFRKKISSKRPKKNIAVFIDGPNILRKELKIDLEDIKGTLKDFGIMKIGRVFLNQYASDKLVEAVANQGFESITTVGDVDVSMAVDATESIFNQNIDVICLVTRDADFLPVVIKAKRYGKETIVILGSEASASSLKNTADTVIVLDKK